VAVPNLTDLKAHLNITVDTDDAELQETLDAALELVADLVGPIAEGVVTETHYGMNSGALVLRRMPVAELTAVSSRSGATTTALTLDDYELDAATGLVRRVDGGRFYGSFVVTYSTGRESVPASLRLAVLIVAAHLWETQRMPGFQSGDSLPAGFGGLDGVPDQTMPGRGFAIPNRAQELLRPYLLGPVIA
jgi:uncharacterized phiE125 gp8 family phage protein